ncbi:oxygen-independent coproporphyrinogen III oxidase [Oceanobacillus piezotolerans]|uniref:Heme chaperone HemW n=1 Tax=Oceanobacillus piezotolerans TaxID=2448030 RepID=A0A498DAM3_9BACI|nr:radical SAM family heme chaperone HemW [Oceanobacillus piezotolerans]RLL48031.1 oxygen-independent coproporphyrinogen III oxidase [Oceanobacillus piezotolerans]
MEQVQSVYIHIPFCQQICHYCDFVKFFYNEKLATEYLYALEKEINTSIKGKKNKVKTIYIGGGTPTALNFEQLKFLLKLVNEKFDIASCEEFTIEVNPGDIDEQKTKLLKEYGISRISFGVQVMDDDLLEELGRVHRVRDVYHTVDLFYQQNFTNISLDLMYALPHQTVEQFKASLDEALTFKLPHYATYGLQIEPKTVFYLRHQKGKLHRPSEDDEVHMYELLRETMASQGIKQYEISNFAIPGYESKHNLTYWGNGYYYGFGAGAHGYLPGKRITNIRPLPAYVKKAYEDGKPVLHVDEITLKEKIEEEVFLGLRRMKGINTEEFNRKFGISFDTLYKQELDTLMERQWLQKEEYSYRLTDQGLLISNQVFEKFMLDDVDLAFV